VVCVGYVFIRTEYVKDVDVLSIISLDKEECGVRILRMCG
jgi:hypothetical protein